MQRDAIGLQISLDVEGKTALVVGGGAEADDKVTRLVDANARVSVVSRTPGVVVSGLARDGRIALFGRGFENGDLNSADLVFVCEKDEALAEKVHAAAADRGVAIWCCDDPARSDLAMPALARIGRARIAISTAGAAPALAGRIRLALERDLGAPFVEFLEALAAERERLRTSEPDIAKRKAALVALVEGFDLHVEPVFPAPKKDAETGP